MIQGDLDEEDPAEGTSKSVVPTQGFEWIAHGDVSARRRARAHVTRGFRRAKAAQAQLEKGVEVVVQKKAKSSKCGSPPDSRSGSSTTSPVASPPIYIEEVTSTTLVGTGMGSGRTDPFSSLPVTMSPDTHALLDHCKSIPKASSSNSY